MTEKLQPALMEFSKENEQYKIFKDIGFCRWYFISNHPLWII